MVRIGILALIAALVGFSIYVAMLPAQFAVVRSTTIEAPPEVVFPHVNNLARWQGWSPWAKRDPDAKFTYEGPEAGVGAVALWDGNDEVGQGKMRIAKSETASALDIVLTFIEPFAGTSDVTFAFAPVDAGGEKPEGTKVTWTMNSEQPFMERALVTLMGMDMEAMIGADYETGLGNLKRLVEAAYVPEATIDTEAPTVTEPAPDAAAQPSAPLVRLAQ